MAPDTPASDAPPVLTLIIRAGEPRFAAGPFSRAAAQTLDVTPTTVPPLPEGPVYLLLDMPDEALSVLAGLARDGTLARLSLIEVLCTDPAPLIGWLRDTGFALTDKTVHAEGAVLTLRRDTRLEDALAARDALQAELTHLDQRFRAARKQADEAFRAAKAANQHRRETEVRLALIERDRQDLAARLAQAEAGSAEKTAHIERLNALVDEALHAGVEKP